MVDIIQTSEFVGSDTIMPVMGKEQYSFVEHKSSTKEFLLKWGTRIGLVAIGLMALSWLL